MNAGLIDRIVGHTENAASAMFGSAIGFATYGWLSVAMHPPQPLAFGAAAGALSFLVCRMGLAALTRTEPSFRLPVFTARDLESVGIDELVLTAADQIVSPLAPPDQEPLELNDALPRISDDSRVVHLFDRNAMPSAYQSAALRKQRVYAAGMPDASQALSDALAELRQSLR